MKSLTTLTTLLKFTAINMKYLTMPTMLFYFTTVKKNLRLHSLRYLNSLLLK